MGLLFRSTVDSAARWQAQLTRLTQELDIRVWPEIGDPAEIDYALVWRPEPGFLASLPNLKLILSLGAGVDHLLVDPQLPRHLPIVRLVDPHMTDAMSEYVVLQALRLHRRDLDYRAQQEAGHTGMAPHTRNGPFAAAPAGDVEPECCKLFCGVLAELAEAEDADTPLDGVRLIELAPDDRLLLGAVFEVPAVQAQHLQNDVLAHRVRHVGVDEPDDRQVARQ